ncbi:MAG TPA: toll/interleukin-1 receptor domain-containing protein [Steroidobacteraceae bacterium]|nr:toll/interleukin-1 receptor domain-containing protein [Steroidobacteraceae bacterium]
MTDKATSHRYAAFISYSHKDRGPARWLHRAIETYRIPRQVLDDADEAPDASATRRRRLTPVFLDREELPTSVDLAQSVRDALERSDFLIVICSPNAAASHWVDEEVRLFKAMGRADRILCLVTEGEPAAERKGLSPLLECLPPALRFEVEDGRVTDRPAAEPLAADIRRGQDSRVDASLKIIAALLDVPLDRLRQRDVARRHRRLAWMGLASTVGCFVLAGLAIAAWVARNEAERQRVIAEQKSMTAQRTADFVVSLFRVSDPSEARGNTITAREILERGARQIDEALRSEPNVRADLSTTLGEVYTGLGLYGPAYELLSKARAVPGQATAARIRQTVSMAELEFQRGNDARADELLTLAAALQRSRPGTVDPALHARLLLDRGDVAAVRERDRDAQRLYDEALRLAERHGLRESATRALEGLGMSSFYAGDMEAAQHWYDRALAARVETFGETHPKVSETLTAMGSIAYMRGESAQAEEYWLRSLAVDRRVLDPQHPDLAATMVNLGRLRVERREFAQAIEVLEQAVDMMVPQHSKTHDSLVFGYTNLALARMGIDDYAGAEPLLRKALQAAVQTRHRLEGPILTDLADLHCRVGRTREGLAHLAAAQPLVAQRYADEPWRQAHLQNVKAACYARDGRLQEAVKLVASSTPVVLEKWPAATFYGHDTLARAASVYQSLGDQRKAAEYRRMAARTE